MKVMISQKGCCKTCRLWKEGSTRILGECRHGDKSTTFDQECKIDKWEPEKELEKKEQNEIKSNC